MPCRRKASWLADDPFFAIVYFVDETQELEALYWSKDGSPPFPQHADRPSQEQRVVESTTPTIDNVVHQAQTVTVSPFSRPSSTPAASWREALDPTPLPPVYSAIPPGSTLGLANYEHHDDVVFPFTQPHEVRLMKYYLEYMCTWVSLSCENL